MNDYYLRTGAKNVRWPLINLVQCTTQTLIKMSIGLPLWHSIDFDFFLQIQGNCRWYSKVHGASFVYAIHSPVGPMNVRWSENAFCYIFKIPHKNKFIFSLFQKNQKHKKCV